MKVISPECHQHNHVDCPLNSEVLKCQCMCHKVAGE